MVAIGQRVQPFSYKENKFQKSNVQHGDYTTLYHILGIRYDSRGLIFSFLQQQNGNYVRQRICLLTLSW